MTFKIFYRLACIAAICLGSGCANTPDGPSKPLSFAQYSPIYLSVANVEFVDEYKAPLKAPNVEQEFSTSPLEAVHIWVKDRIRTTGGDGLLQVIIKDGRVVETPLSRTQGIKGVFTNDQAYRYDARLELEMRIYGARAISEASLIATATRSETLPENASVASRDALFDRMTRKMMDDMNAELERSMHKYFASYIDYSGDSR